MRAALLVVAVALCSGACGGVGSGHHPEGQPSTSGHGNGSEATVRGIVRGYGGPAVLVQGTPKQALNGDPMARQQVTASRSSKVVAETTSDQAGRYVLHLPAGPYTLSACGIAAGSVQVTLRSDELKAQDLSCLVP